MIPDQSQDKSLDRIPKDIPLILLPDCRIFYCLARKFVGSGYGPTRDSGSIEVTVHIETVWVQIEEQRIWNREAEGGW